MGKFLEGIVYFSPLMYAAGLFVVMSLLFYFEKEFIKHLEKNKIAEQLIIGVTFGLGVIYANELGSINIGGPLINARDAGPLCAGLLFGAPAGLIAGVIGGTERWFSVYWGAGTYTRLGCSLACVIAGIIAGLFRNFVFHKKKPSAISGFFLAIVSEVIHLLLVFITHPNDVHHAFEVVKQCTFPIVIATTCSVFVTLFIVNLYIKFVEKKEGIVRQRLSNLTSVVQRRIFYLIALSTIFSMVFVGLLFYNATIAESESTIKLSVEDTYNAYYKKNQQFEEINIADVVANSHIGGTGKVIITDEHFNVITYLDSDSKIIINRVEIGDSDIVEEGKLFRARINGEKALCVYKSFYDKNLVGYYPTSEAFFTMEMVLFISAFIYVIIFALLFVLIYVLVNTMVVKNIDEINENLDKISNGDLNTVVNVRPYIEFHSLSNGINKMVVALKRLIAEAEARIAAELEFAKKIQYSALPVAFSSSTGEKSFDIYASMKTAKEVGGDFYDFYYLGERKFAFLIADVSGKGIPAAMFMMKAKSIIKSFAETNVAIEKVATWANSELCENNNAEMFVTAFICIIDLATGKVEYINAGHNPPVYVKKNEKAEYLHSKGNFVLAGIENFEYKKGEFMMEDGDAIFLYTDGVTEAINKKEELYGEQRLLNVIDNNRLETMQNLCDNISNDLISFVDGADQFDDITMLAFRYKGEK